LVHSLPSSSSRSSTRIWPEQNVNRNSWQYKECSIHIRPWPPRYFLVDRYAWDFAYFSVGCCSIWIINIDCVDLFCGQINTVHQLKRRLSQEIKTSYASSHKSYALSYLFRNRR
jgi:hypothetical protein